MGTTDGVAGAVVRLYELFAIGVTTPIVLAEYLQPKTGAAYGVGLPTKLLVAARMLRNALRIPTGSTYLEHLVVATKLLQVPPEVEGSVVECGSYKGGSTANLSLAASLCGRRLEVFDSFEGMPAPGERDRAHVCLASEEIHTYAENDWRASLAEARENVRRYGDPSACRFHVGYFEATLPDFERPCALVVLDVGLRASAETCIEHLWPRLADGRYLFSHDVQHMPIAALFFDESWWEATLDRSAPGLVGAGSGLGLHPGANGFSSLLGYTVRNPQTEGFTEVRETGP